MTEMLITPENIFHVGFEILTAADMKCSIFWDVTP
jgi:hypothetical protein